MQEYRYLRAIGFNRIVEELGRRTADFSESRGESFFFLAGARSRTRVIRGRASDVLPRMAARSYDMVVLDVEPEESAALIDQALRMLRVGGVLAVTRALWNDHVADPARRDPATVAARELGKALREREDLLTSLLPVGDGLLVAVRRS